MKSNELWDRLGSLEDTQATQVLTQLFVRYEQRWEQCPDDPVVTTFFSDLDVVISLVQSCNVSRR